MRSPHKFLISAAILASTLALSGCSVSVHGFVNPTQSALTAPSPLAPSSAPVALPSVAQDKAAATASFSNLLDQVYNISSSSATQLPIVDARYGSIPDQAYLDEVQELLPSISVFENPSFGTSVSAKIVHSFLSSYLSSNNGEALQFPSKVTVTADTSKVTLSPDQQKATFPLSALTIHYKDKSLPFPVSTDATAQKVSGKWYLDSSGL